MLYVQALAAPELAEEATTSTSFTFCQLFKFAGVQPNAATLITSVDRHFIDFSFIQCATTSRASHRRGGRSFRLFRDLHFLPQLFYGFLILAVKVFLFQTLSSFIK